MASGGLSNTTSSFSDFKDMFAEISKQTEDSAATASENETDVDDTDADEETKLSKKNLKSKKAPVNHSNMKKTPAGAPGAYLTGSFQFTKDFSVSNPLTVSEPITVSLMGNQTVYYPIAMVLNGQKCVQLCCFNATARKNFASPSSYGSGKKALEALVAKDQAFGEVRECKISFYAAPDAPNPSSTISVNLEQVLEYTHMSRKTFNEKVVIGNTKLVTEIELSEHGSRITVISVCLAMYLMMMCKPNVQVYRMYKNPVEAMPLCLDLSWELSFYRMVRYAEFALSSYSSSASAAQSSLKKMALYKETMEKKVRDAEAKVQQYVTQFQGIREKLTMVTNNPRELNVMLALVTKPADEFKKILDSYIKGVKAANGAAANNATAAAGSKPNTPVKQPVKQTPSAAATQYLTGTGIAAAPLTASSATAPLTASSANGMDLSNS